MRMCDGSSAVCSSYRSRGQVARHRQRTHHQAGFQGSDRVAALLEQAPQRHRRAIEAALMGDELAPRPAAPRPGTATRWNRPQRQTGRQLLAIERQELAIELLEAAPADRKSVV